MWSPRASSWAGRQLLPPTCHRRRPNRWLPNRRAAPNRRPPCCSPQVVLDTVELVLSPAEHSAAPTPASASAASLDPGASEADLAAAVAAAEEAAAAAGGGSGGGWFGSALQSIAVRAGLNVTGAAAGAGAAIGGRRARSLPANRLASPAPAPASCPCRPAVQLTNVVAKWVQDGEFVATATLQQLLLQTSTDAWRQGLAVRRLWGRPGQACPLCLCRLCCLLQRTCPSPARPSRRLLPPLPSFTEPRRLAEEGVQRAAAEPQPRRA